LLEHADLELLAEADRHEDSLHGVGGVRLAGGVCKIFGVDQRLS